MSMFKKYACLYGEIEFTKEERDEVADFVSGVIKCAHTNNVGEWRKLAHRHFDYVPKSTLEKVARYCEYLAVVEGEDNPNIRQAIQGDGITKEAIFGFGKKPPKTISISPAAVSAPPSRMAGLTQSGLLPALGVAAVGLPMLMGALESLTRTRGLKSSLQKIMREHPELRNDANAGRYFQAISDFAPAVATNPLLAGNVMKQLHQIGPAALTPAMIKDLLGVQESVTKMRGGDQQNIKDFGQSLIAMHKANPKPDR